MIVFTLSIILACLFVFTGKHNSGKHSRQKGYKMSATNMLIGVLTCVVVCSTFVMVGDYIDPAIGNDFEITAYADGGEYSFNQMLTTLVAKLDSYKSDKGEVPEVETIDNKETLDEEAGVITAVRDESVAYNEDGVPVETPPCLGSFVDSTSVPEVSENTTPAEKPVAVAKTISTPAAKKSKYNLSEADKVALQRVALAEAKCDGVKGMALVMKVILNRYDSPRFPNSVMSIITQKNQFSTYYNGTFAKAKLCDESAQALELVLSGWDETNGALYFEHNPNGKATWQRKNLTQLFTYKGHTFSK